MVLCKKNIVKRSDDSKLTCNSCIELEDVIIFGISDMIKKISSVFGRVGARIDREDGSFFIIEKPIEDSCEKFFERLKKILDGSMVLSKQNDLDVDYVTSILLILDGWTWTKDVFRSPIWMDDYMEMEIYEAKEIEGLKFLNGWSKDFVFNKVWV